MLNVPFGINGLTLSNGLLIIQVRKEKINKQCVYFLQEDLDELIGTEICAFFRRIKFMLIYLAPKPLKTTSFHQERH